MAVKDEEDWNLPYSGDEAECLNFKDSWEPSPIQIAELYQALDCKGILNIEWQCPGRRSPSHHSNESESVEGQSVQEDITKKLEPNEFDFDDEFGSQSSTPKITPRRRNTPSNSTPKRVASFDKVMFDIVRYRKLDELESQKVATSPNLQRKTSNSSTNNPNS